MNYTKLWINAATLIIYLAVTNPAITGLAMHEWVSLGLFIVLTMHLSMHVEWAAAVIARALQQPSIRSIGSVALVIALLSDLCLVMVSGVMLSRHVLPALGLYASGYFVWKPIHAIASKVLFAFILVHLVLHIDWFLTLFSRLAKRCVALSRPTKHSYD